MEEEIPKIIEKLGQISCSAGKFVQFNSPTHKPVEFSSKNFKKIDAKPENSRIAFIDGGNNPILDSASFSLQFLRTGKKPQKQSSSFLQALLEQETALLLMLKCLAQG